MKETMDAYETFVDDYVAFMKKYENSDDTWGMLADFTSMMANLEEWETKLDKLEESEDQWSAADEAYYTEVHLRCASKLAKYAYLS